MANRNYIGKFMYTGHAMPVQIDVTWDIGATGAVTAGTIKGAYVSSVTRLNTGIYQVKLNDNYQYLYQMRAALAGPASGSTVNAGSFITNTVYQITTVGNTDWHAIGLPTGITAAVGVLFKASGAGSGTGVAAVPVTTGIDEIQLLGNPQLMLNPSTANKGALINIGCFGTTATTTGTAAAQVWTVGTLTGTNAASAVTVTGTNNGDTPPLWTQTGGEAAAQVWTVDTATGTNASSALTATTTLTRSLTDPASGSKIYLSFLLSNSSVTVGGSSTVGAN